MQAYHRVDVQLGKKDQKQIAGMLNKGRESARVLRRALILRQLDRGQTAAQVAGSVGVAPKTVLDAVDGWFRQEEALGAARAIAVRRPLKPAPDRKTVLPQHIAKHILSRVRAAICRGLARFFSRNSTGPGASVFKNLLRYFVDPAVCNSAEAGLAAALMIGSISGACVKTVTLAFSPCFAKAASNAA